MILLTAVQFLYSPFLAYYFYKPDPVYPMEVAADVYFTYAVPAVLLFALGLYLFKQPTNLQYLPSILTHYNLGEVGKKLIIVGLLCDYIGQYLPGSIAFFILLISYFKFIGTYYLYFSESRYRYLWIAAAFAPLIISNVSMGMFHDLLLWGLFTIIVFFIRKSTTTPLKKIAIVLACFLCVYYLNLVKGHYRQATWFSKKQYSMTDRFVVFGESVVKVLSGEGEPIRKKSKYSRTEEEQNLTRLNQGVIVTRIMKHTGKREPFAKGETIVSAIEAALVPRFLNPNKARSGGRDTYTRFTGYALSSNTSISLSLLGEGYANYGYGGIYFMLFLGLFYGLILNRLTLIAQDNPYLLLWIPFLFLMVIKAEEGFETVLNYLIKASFVLWLVYTFYLKRFTYRIENPKQSETKALQYG